MSESNYTRVYTGSFINVQAIMAKLEEIGISGVVKDESESARLSGFGITNPGTQQLLVHNDELDKAVPIVQEIVSGL